MGIKRSGINSIDALLKGKYWTDVGQPITLTYSIDMTGDDGLKSSQAIMVTEALRQWSKVANINFDLVSEGGNLRFSTKNGTDGLADYKEERKWWKPGSWGSDKLNHVKIYLGKDSASGLGKRFLDVALHEIGHALGLKHPGNYNGKTKKGEAPFLPYWEDNRTNTVMSYNDLVEFPKNNPNPVYIYAVAPMPYDIRAIQYLYGARIVNPEDTNYQFDTVTTYGFSILPKNKYFKTSLWDSGGIDTLDFSQLAYRNSGYHYWSRSPLWRRWP